MTDLSQDEAFARIRLLRSPNVGPVSYRQLLRRFGTAVAALEALPADLRGIVESACAHTNIAGLTESEWFNAASLTPSLAASPA